MTVYWSIIDILFPVHLFSAAFCVTTGPASHPHPDAAASHQSESLFSVSQMIQKVHNYMEEALEVMHTW